MSGLLDFLKPDETAAGFLARTHAEPISTGLFFAASLRPGQVLEISGPSGAAKSEILIQVSARRLLPRFWQSLPIGGHSEHVVLYDLDRKFDGIRLYHVLLTHLKNLPGEQQLREEDAIDAAKEAFSRFHLVQCSSSFKLLAALRTADDLLATCEKTGSIKLVLLDNIAAFCWTDRFPPQSSHVDETGSIKLLLLDNIAAFYWIDRANTELPEYAIHRESDAQMGLQQAHACIAAELVRILRERRLALVATRHAALSAGGYDRGEVQDAWAFREFLPKPWQDLVTMRILVRGPSHSNAAQEYPCFAAKWQTPHSDSVQGFAVTEQGIVQC